MSAGKGTSHEVSVAVVEAIRKTASRLAHDTEEAMAEYYGDASDWLRDNYGQAMAVAGAVVLIGSLGIFLGSRAIPRRSRKGA